MDETYFIDVVEDRSGNRFYLVKAVMDIGLFDTVEDAERHMARMRIDYARRGPEHPASLLGEPHPLMRDGRWPASVLDSKEYKEALEKYRRQK